MTGFLPSMHEQASILLDGSCSRYTSRTPASANASGSFSNCAAVNCQVRTRSVTVPNRQHWQEILLRERILNIATRYREPYPLGKREP
jgi:hypothetical protein